MVTKIMERVSITALLMVVSWRPFASYQMPVDFVVCAGSVMGGDIQESAPLFWAKDLPVRERARSMVA